MAASCGTRRGVVTARRADPADGKNGQAPRDRLAADLAAARAKLNWQRKALTATERAIAELSQRLMNARG